MSLYQNYADRLKIIMKKCMQKKEYETAMAAVSAYSKLSYEWNQFYSDDEVEEIVYNISNIIVCNQIYDGSVWQENKYTVLFYDGFGLDTRGLALIYAKALTQLHYKIIWVTKLEAQGCIPEIENTLLSGDSIIEYIDMTSSHSKHSKCLFTIFEKYQPSKAFLYTIPNDVSGNVVFCHYNGVVERFKINLTDHAFWLGKNAFDICIEFREYGAGISAEYRKIPQEKIRILPFYPWIDKKIKFQGFDFDIQDKKLVFSGGSLYKTLGGNNQFYKIVNKILAENQEVVFVYAGEGDTTQLQKVMNKYPDRVYHIPERKDLFAMLERADVYLNTYPMIGGLMTQYAALAKKVPLILNDTGKEDASGILSGQKNAGIEFESVDKVVMEINKLLSDDKYRIKRGEEIQQCVNTEGNFKEMLNNILNKNEDKTDVLCPDTNAFLKPYVERFNNMSVIKAIVSKKNVALLRFFPDLYIKKIIAKAKGY